MRELLVICRANDILLIPQFNCLGHQSWADNTFPLLTQYPEFDETPETPSDNPGFYCRSWCPLHPEINKIVFELFDELIEAFDAEYFHVGMDEVFEIASDQCPRCKGKDPAELFAKAVNDYHEYLVGEKGLTMLIWGDRLLNSKEMGYGKYEGSMNGTEAAIDMIPKDIIVCDWHYGLMVEYKSIPHFLKKGFRVWPASFNDTRAAISLLYYAQRQDSDRMLGHLCTTWSPDKDPPRALLEDQDPKTISKEARDCARTLGTCMKLLKEMD